MATDSVFPINVEDEFIAKRTTMGLILTRLGRLSSQILAATRWKSLVKLNKAQVHTSLLLNQRTLQAKIQYQQEDKKVDTFIHKSCGCQLGHSLL